MTFPKEQNEGATPTNELCPKWGSDVVALALVELDIPYFALTPGASFRGLHDSLVNFLEDRGPELVLCAHEQNAVAIAHGYAKATDTPMLVGLHANVGLMNATMAIYNAFCDRVPMIIVGATGPGDAPKRRPWIDWIHTSQDQGGLIRNFVKWDAQVASPSAAVEAIHRANIIARTPPCGPVYICLDVEMQEVPINDKPLQLDKSLYRPGLPPYPQKQDTELLVSLFEEARSPLLLIGRVTRDRKSWDQRITLAERTGALVLTDIKQSAAFPTDHPNHTAPPIMHMTSRAGQLVRDADLILSLDWIDLGGLVSFAEKDGPVTAKIIHVSLDQYVHNGWSFDHQALAPADIRISSRPEELVESIVKVLGSDTKINIPKNNSGRTVDFSGLQEEELDYHDIAAALGGLDVGDLSIIRFPIGWPTDAWKISDPLDHLGNDGGAGVGSGPGMAVGAALSLAKAGRVPVAVLGDGDTLMMNNAFWTAAHCKIPLLVIVANNRSYFNDERHQDQVAEHRGRDRENRGVGIRIENPDIDFTKLAEAQGWWSVGPVKDRIHLRTAVENALANVRKGGQCLIDVHVMRAYAH